MENVKQNGLIRILVPICFVIMIGINSLANALPLNGVTTGGVSDSFTNLFTPQALTFAIWGVIYFLVLLYVLYHLGLFRSKESSTELLNKTGLLFIITCLVNSAWIFAWHYLQFGLSVVLMLGLLVSLLVIYERIGRRAASRVETWTVNVPFSIYLGWITVATVANIASLLISLGWNGFGIPAVLTVVMIGVATLLGVLMILLKREIAYPLVLIWAFAGIAAVRADVPVVEIGAIVAAALLLLVMLARIGIGLKQRAKA